MTTRKARIYLVQFGDETKLVRANGVSQAIQAVAKDFLNARVAESDDLIRIANAAGAGIEVATPTPRGEWTPGGRGRPPKSASAPAPTDPNPNLSSAATPAYEPSQAAA